MLDHIDLYRRLCLGSFRDLLLEVTRDPAMLLFLNGANSDKNSPNENFGREIMELFTLGADRGAYTEDDVRAGRPRADRLARRLRRPTSAGRTSATTPRRTTPG